MEKSQINKRSSWQVLETAADILARGDRMPAAAFAAIADRLRSAIESPDPRRIEQASSALENFLRETLAGATANIQAVSRGHDEIDDVSGTDATTLYALGKVAFAQLLAARIADTRVDARFVQYVSDNRYLPLLLRLRERPHSVSELRERTGERLETVSRKLAILRGLGIVAWRRQGNVVMNLLTPAAENVLAARALSASGDKPVTGVGDEALDPEARDILGDLREGLPPHMQRTMPFAGRPNLKAVA